MPISLDETKFLLNRLRGKIEEKLATNSHRGTAYDAPYVSELVDQVFESFQQDARDAQPKPEIIRVLRVYVFEGERKQVEEQLARSLGDGTRYVGSRPGDGLKGTGIKIHVATVGTIPQILPLNAGYPGWAGKGYATDLNDMPIAEPLGAQAVYVFRPKWPGNIRTEYNRAVACGATAILIPSEGIASNLYTMENFRKAWVDTLEPEAAQPEQAPQDPPPAAPEGSER